MQTKEKNNILFIRLFKDENIINKIQEACVKHKIQSAIILSAVGQFKSVKLGYFKEKGNYSPTEIKKPLELLSLTGNISKKDNSYNLHLHTILGDEEKNSLGGHLIDGIISVTAEIAILKIEMNLKRKQNKDTGLLDLVLE